MPVHLRSAVPLAAVVTLLACPMLGMAASRRSGAKPKKAHVAQHGARPHAASGRSAAARGQGDIEQGSPLASDRDAVLRWEDQNGTVHYTHRYEIPERFRPRAQHVYVTVGSVPLDHADAASPAPPLEGRLTPPAVLAVVPVPPAPARSSAPLPQDGSPGAAQGATARTAPPASGPPPPTQGAAAR